MTLLTILAVLFAALFIIIPLIEKSKVRVSDEDSQKMARWIYPLMMVTLILALIMALID
ncbi:hypothetical protein QTP81_11415 [Alteromonas sp. ASW11-36]|uniref:Uncharacterized protein n=1 Tax=Alteromonas arenosi TaxID=3055817 RepID=A0ABT7SYE3_9ALTE|nr:hypothetical protein [Alteromonas sp. ASW11-36]MDM7861202.1 hypothetical protein [Alteromonas sp. ASW11-36]